MRRVVCLGGALVDLIAVERDMPLKDCKQFRKEPGGSAANVAAGTAKLGVSTTFITTVGDDPFGDFLVDTLKATGVDVIGIQKSPTAFTRLNFNANWSDGRLECFTYKSAREEPLFSADAIDSSLYKENAILHFARVCIQSDKTVEELRKVLELAQSAGMIISFDPNYRPSGWESVEKFKERLDEFLPFVDVIKVSDEEVEVVAGTGDLVRAAKNLSKYGIPLLFFSKGSRGAEVYCADLKEAAQGIPITVADTVGAGDAFVSAVLTWLASHKVDKQNLAKLTRSELKEIVGFANAAGAYTATRVGAISGLPALEDLRKFASQ